MFIQEFIYIHNKDDVKALRLALSVIKPHILLAARLRNDMETFSTLLAF